MIRSALVTVPVSVMVRVTEVNPMRLGTKYHGGLITTAKVRSCVPRGIQKTTMCCGYVVIRIPLG